MTPNKALTVTFTESELPDLRKVLDRAMNTWDPHDQPGWLQDLSDLVDKALATQVAAPAAAPSKFGGFDLQAQILAQIRAQQLLDKAHYQGVAP